MNNSEKFEGTSSGRAHSFGSRIQVFLDTSIESEIEFMVFEKSGKMHAHKKTEMAVCVEGCGTVEVAGEGGKQENHQVMPGDIVVVDANAYHRMVPAVNSILKMIIVYEKVED